MTTATRSRKSSDQPAPTGAGNGAAADPVLAQLAQVDAIDEKANPDGPLGETAIDSSPAAGALLVVPTPFLVQTCAQVAAGIVSASKKAGWPGLPALYVAVVPEEEWLSQVAQNGAAVIAKRWPALNSESTPEFALCALALPWLAWAVPNGFILLFRFLRNKPQPQQATEPATDGKSNRDPRRDGERQNNPHEETVARFPAGVPDRPDTRSEI